MQAIVEYDITAEYERQYDDQWRIHSAKGWSHGFNSKKVALKMCEAFGGDAIGLATFDFETGFNRYSEVIEL